MRCEKARRHHTVPPRPNRVSHAAVTRRLFRPCDSASRQTSVRGTFHVLRAGSQVERVEREAQRTQSNRAYSLHNHRCSLEHGNTVSLGRSYRAGVAVRDPFVRDCVGSLPIPHSGVHPAASPRKHGRSWCGERWYATFSARRTFLADHPLQSRSCLGCYRLERCGRVSPFILIIMKADTFASDDSHLISDTMGCCVRPSRHAPIPWSSDMLPDYQVPWLMHYYHQHRQILWLASQHYVDHQQTPHH